MATQKDTKQALQSAPEQGTLMTLVKESVNELSQVLPKNMNPERIVGIALTSIRLNPKLAQCTPESFMGSLFVLAQIGLEPIAGRAYLLPFYNNRKDSKGNWRKVYEVQALIGYKGMAELFYRHESALTIDMQTVRKNDEFSYEYGTNAYLKHKPNMGDRGPVIGYYAIAKMRSGGEKFQYMSQQQCLDHAKKHSKVFSKKDNKFLPNTPWVTDVDAMCMKTVMIQLAKLLPLSVEMQRAVSVDETSREYRKGIKDAMDLPDTTSWNDKTEDAEIVPDKPKKEGPKPEKERVEDESPQVKDGLPENIINAINKVKERIGNDKFLKILGGVGYEKVEDIPNIKEANRLLKELANGS